MLKILHVLIFLLLHRTCTRKRIKMSSNMEELFGSFTNIGAPMELQLIKDSRVADKLFHVWNHIIHILPLNMDTEKYNYRLFWHTFLRLVYILNSFIYENSSCKQSMVVSQLRICIPLPLSEVAISRLKMRNVLKKWWV